MENLRKLKLVEKVIHTERQALMAQQVCGLLMISNKNNKIREIRLIFCKELLDLKGFCEYNGLDVFKTDQ